MPSNRSLVHTNTQLEARFATEDETKTDPPKINTEQLGTTCEVVSSLAYRSVVHRASRLACATRSVSRASTTIREPWERMGERKIETLCLTAHCVMLNKIKTLCRLLSRRIHKHLICERLRSHDRVSINVARMDVVLLLDETSGCGLRVV